MPRLTALGQNCLSFTEKKRVSSAELLTGLQPRRAPHKQGEAGEQERRSHHTPLPSQANSLGPKQELSFPAKDIFGQYYLNVKELSEALCWLELQFKAN